MAFGRRIKFEALRSQTAAGPVILTTYIPLGLPLDSKVRSVSVRNLTNQTLIFSYGDLDPITQAIVDNDVLPAGAGVVYDLTANSNQQTDAPFMANLTQIYVRYPAGGTQPTTGAAYVVAFYCLGD